MRIKLDDTHYLNNDSRCYWITAIVTPKEGSKKKKPYEMRVSGYQASFERAVESYIEGKINSSNATNITALKNEIKALKREVRAWKSEE